MPRPVTALQQAVLEVLWARGAASGPEVQEALAETHPRALSTVNTILARLAKAGAVTRVGRRPIRYRAVLQAADARRAAVEQVLRQHFDGAAVDLVAYLVAEHGVSVGEVARARTRLGLGG